MQQFFNDLHVTRKTRNGALVLLFILVLLIFLWRMLPAIIPPPDRKDEIALQAAWSKFKKENMRETPDSLPRSFEPYRKKQSYGAATSPSVLFPFDPNTASEADLLRLGLPRYTVNTILKFRAKNPRAFKKKEDLRKLYTLRKEDYERIAPYIDIPEQTVVATGSYKPPATVRQQVTLVELNSADAAQLMSLRGIGPGYAKRIIAFRSALGGFTHVDQLKEVYGFPDSTFQQLKGRFMIDRSLVRKINVNTADENALAMHPYIKKKLAADIVKLRNDIGLLSDLEQLRQVPLINEEKYRKIAPYLSTR